MGIDIERRRTIRIRKSSLITNGMVDLDKPSIKISEELDEFAMAFKLVYQSYEDVGYITKGHSSKMLYSIHSMLPTTCVFVFKQYLNVISTLTHYLDNEKFGLPMDSLYKDEVDELRRQGRKIAEIGSLATSKESRWNNLIMFLGKAYFQYAKISGINDILITVNPKHAPFYKAIFLFEDFAELKHYPTVNAPAVALRINYDIFWEKLEETFKDHEFETNLHTFFSKINNTEIDSDMHFTSERNIPLSKDTAKFLFENRPEIIESLTRDQATYLKKHYDEAFFYIN